MSENSTTYRVLARKYRPGNFDDLIGHEAMVRTLSNALEAGRLAHAFVLTGTRGIGKTTTARIIAKGLNCIGEDGNGGPTVHPCGKCENCLAISEDRHQDVLEMDAASRTGVDDIREIIDGVRYLPINARYKIYIIDEVHMLSKNAFNALLKTLEEPPEHVKFIFATTEIRKIPVTVLSRCQRFDLKRVDAETLKSYFGTIAEKENATVDDEALSLIARAAEGSVRDGLSLLDQAIAHGDGNVSAEQARDMLGLADRSIMFDLLNLLLEGKIEEALTLLRDQYARGADPVVILQDLLELTHSLTALKVSPSSAKDMALGGIDVSVATEISGKLSMPVLARTWQMLLKGLEEVKKAPQALAAAEMILIRLAFSSDLPTPGQLAKNIQPSGNSAGNAPVAGAGSGPNGGATAVAGSAAIAVSNPNPIPSSPPSSAPRAHLKVVENAAPAAEPVVAPVETPQPEIKTNQDVHDLESLIKLLSDRSDVMLKGQVINFVRPVKFEEGLLEFSPANGAPADLAARLGKRLRDLTGNPWQVKSVAAEGAQTLAEKRISDKAALIASVEKLPLITEIREKFKGATIREVRDLSPDLEILPGEGISDESDFE